MNLHEYQAKILLKNNNVRVLNGYPVLDDSDIETAVDSIQTVSYTHLTLPTTVIV